MKRQVACRVAVLLAVVMASGCAGSPYATWTDPASGLTWQDPAAPVDMSFDAAREYCEGNNDDLPGSGWRLPSFDELRSLLRRCPPIAPGGPCPVGDACRVEACGTDDCSTCTSGEWTTSPDDPCLWPVGLSGECGMHWSSTQVEDVPGYHWALSYGRGSYAVVEVPADWPLWVRCVR